MAFNNIFQKAKIAIATPRLHKNNFQDEHITTSDFCNVSLAKYLDLVPKSKVDFNLRAFARLAPLSVPTFGRAHMNVRAFFVPYRTVWLDWNNFITDTPTTDDNGIRYIPASTPQIRNVDLLGFFFTNSQSVSDSAVADFETNYNGTTGFDDVIRRRRLTSTGARALKLLNTLGIHPQFYCQVSEANNILFDALPLLCYCKIMLDWYWPAQYTYGSQYQAIERILLHRSRQYYTLTSSDLGNILGGNGITTIFYDGDYFTSAFDNPAAPGASVGSPVSIPIPGPSNLNQPATYGSGSDYPMIDLSDGDTLTHYALDALKRLQDYLRRHQLVGARALDRFLARFGVSLPSDKLTRSVYLGNHEIPLLTGDVMSTSETGNQLGSTVGSYAGKGFLAGKDGHFEFETNEYGMLMFVYSIVPHVGYYQGTHRRAMYKSRLDFYTPEFDGIGNRAISMAELYTPMRSVGGQIDEFGGIRAGIFGYTPQYSEYKVGHDVVSGDFMLASRSQAGFASDSWHLMRNLEDSMYDSSQLVHSLDFLNSSIDKESYNRIFQFTDSGFSDHFSIHFFFGYSITSPLLPLYEGYDFEEEGKKVTAHINGSKVD